MIVRVRVIPYYVRRRCARDTLLSCHVEAAKAKQSGIADLLQGCFSFLYFLGRQSYFHFVASMCGVPYVRCAVSLPNGLTLTAIEFSILVTADLVQLLVLLGEFPAHGSFLKFDRSPRVPFSGITMVVACGRNMVTESSFLTAD